MQEDPSPIREEGRIMSKPSPNTPLSPNYQNTKIKKTFTRKNSVSTKNSTVMSSPNIFTPKSFSKYEFTPL